MPVHQGAPSGLSPRKVGQHGGRAEVDLTVSQIPSHNHNVLVNNSVDQASRAMPGPKSLLGATVGTGFNPRVYRKRTGSGFALDSVIQEEGGGKAHANEQPYLAVNYIICLQGHYPAP